MQINTYLAIIKSPRRKGTPDKSYAIGHQRDGFILWFTFILLFNIDFCILPYCLDIYTMG